MKIIEKLFIIQHSIPYLKKDSNGFNFKYVDEESVLEHVKPLLSKHGLVASPTIDNYNVIPIEIVKTNKTGEVKSFEYLFTGNGKITFVDVQSFETLDFPWVFTGSAEDPAQAFGASMTYCLRYFFLKTLLIPTGNDDPDKWRNKTNVQNSPTTNEDAPKTASKDKVDKLGVITEKQRTDLVARLKTEDDKNRFLEIIKGFGYASSKEIKPEHYDTICKKFDEHGLPFTL